MQESISFDKDLRKAIRKTTKILSKAVKSTLGPSGTNVGVLSKINLPVIVNDGVTVSKSIKFKDPLKDYIANILKTVSQNTDNIAGDGTSTSITLTEAILIAGLKNIELGSSQIDISRGIKEATILILKELENKKISVIDDENRLLQVSSISANNDNDLGKIISQAFLKVGVDGQIEVKDSPNKKTYIDVINGMKYNSGYMSNMFINTQKSEVELQDVSILIYEGKLKTIDPILASLQEVRNKNTSLLIIADDFSEQAINDLTYNKINAQVKVCAVKSPGYGKSKEDNLEDIAIVTESTVISKRFGTDIDNFTLDCLGKASSVKINSDSFILMSDNKENETVANKIKELKTEAEKKSNSTAKDELLDRIAVLSNGVAVMYVSGNSPVEIAEKKYRIEDAIHATRASLEDGIVPGGGVTLLRLGKALKMPKLDNKDQEIGFQILIKALEAPIKTIAKNSGAEPSIVLNKVLKSEKFNYGYDAKTKKYGDMLKAGIIDPVKVTKAALVNASSVSQMLLTMNTAIYG